MEKILVAWIIALSIISASLVSCTHSLVEYRAEPGSSASVSKLTEDEYWKRHVDDHIAAEKAGQGPEAGYATWREYYQWWYGVLRKKSKPPWKSREFKTSEDLVNYIKERRRAKGLRPYDD
jgi:hypothetical protein